MLDYARTFGLPTVVFRMSCIYGPHQFGTEDQGWVAHFLHPRAATAQPITLYGDGMQVRDILFVDDLVDAMLLRASAASTALAGQAFNIGGGPGNAISLLELLDLHRASCTAGARRSRFERLAHRRPALLRLRHAHVPAGDRLDAAGRRVAEGVERLTAGCVGSRAASAAAPRRALAAGARRDRGGASPRCAPR